MKDSYRQGLRDISIEISKTESGKEIMIYFDKHAVKYCVSLEPDSGYAWDTLYFNINIIPAFLVYTKAIRTM